MHHYPFHISDFNNATRHLTRLERSIYRDLIDHYYHTEKPIPDDIISISRIILAHTEEERTAVEQVLNEFFTKQEDGLFYNHYCEQIIQKYHKQIEDSSKAGKASAKARALKAAKNKGSEQAFNDRSTDGQPTKNQEPLTKNQEPLNNTENKFSDDDLKLANFIWERILRLNPKAKKPKLNTWAETIRITREQDKRTHKELQDVFLWANQDSFWQKNILSPKTLRKQFDSLVVKMKPVSKADSFSDLDYGEPEGDI